MVALLFPGLPGGIELLVVLVLLSGLVVVVPLVLVVGAYLFGKRRGRAESTRDGDAEVTDR